MSLKFETDEVLRELAAMENAKVRAINERNGDDHGVNLSQLRALAKRMKTRHDLALALWATGKTPARLVSTLVCQPRLLSADELQTMVRDIRSPKLLDWFVVNVAKQSQHAEELRVLWMDGHDLVGRAGWSLTVERIVRDPDGLALDELLGTIEREMGNAPERKQWSMNHCLAEIGIRHPSKRHRAIEIGEKLAVLIDYPTPKGCTSPYAPTWIAEMVQRSGQANLARSASN